MRKTLLPEIGLLVIDQLAAEEDWQIKWEDAHHIRALANCALTCKDWLHRSRINLYRSLYVHSNTSLPCLYSTFALHQFLRRLVQTVKVDIRRRDRDGVPFHEVLLFMRKVLYPLPCRLVIIPGNTRDLPMFSMNNMTRKCLPLFSRVICELCITNITISHLLLLLRNLPHISVLKHGHILDDPPGARKNLVYPRHLNLSTFHVCNQSSLPLLPMLILGYIRTFLGPPLGTHTAISSSLPFSSCVTRH